MEAPNRTSQLYITLGTAERQLTGYKNILMLWQPDVSDET